VAFLGHHRCATSWIGDVFGGVCRELGLRYAAVHNARATGSDLRRFVETRRLEALAYTNAEYAQVAALPHLRAFHVVRDPRDVAVSAYFSHLYSHRVDDEWPELAARRERLQRLTEEEGLLAELEALRWDFDCMREWNYATPDILELRMEDLTACPYDQFLRVFRFLGLLDEERFSLVKRALHTLSKGLRVAEALAGGGVRVPIAPGRIPAERLLGIVWENEFRKKTAGRERGREEPTHHYRKGVAGDWRNHFTPAHVAYVERHYGDLLTRLGYAIEEAVRAIDESEAKEAGSEGGRRGADRGGV
jgi:hypothetical protein